jgi:large subunit ribosomal protein L22
MQASPLALPRPSVHPNQLACAPPAQVGTARGPWRFGPAGAAALLSTSACPQQAAPQRAGPPPAAAQQQQKQQQRPWGQQQAQEQQRRPAAAGTDERPPVSGVCRRQSLPMGYKKLEFVLTLARRRHVDDALAQLAACPKRAALVVRHAVANARNNAIAQGADVARLIVERVWTGRGTPLRKPWFHGRGYHSVRQHRRTHLTVIVQEAPPGMRVPHPAALVRPAMMRPRRERRFPRPGAAAEPAAAA